MRKQFQKGAVSESLNAAHKLVVIPQLLLYLGFQPSSSALRAVCIQPRLAHQAENTETFVQNSFI